MWFNRNANEIVFSPVRVYLLLQRISSLLQYTKYMVNINKYFKSISNKLIAIEYSCHDNFIPTTSKYITSRLRWSLLWRVLCAGNQSKEDVLTMFLCVFSPSLLLFLLFPHFPLYIKRRMKDIHCS